MHRRRANVASDDRANFRDDAYDNRWRLTRDMNGHSSAIRSIRFKCIGDLGNAHVNHRRQSINHVIADGGSRHVTHSRAASAHTEFFEFHAPYIFDLLRIFVFFSFRFH